MIYVLLTAIPYLGWVIGLAATLLGLGAFWQALKIKKIKVE